MGEAEMKQTSIVQRPTLNVECRDPHSAAGADHLSLGERQMPVRLGPQSGSEGKSGVRCFV
jgi:hypothetical protein